VKLTAKGRYAVMAVADMAAQGASARSSLTEISQRQGISLSFLEQLFGKLRRAGIVDSHRGASELMAVRLKRNSLAQGHPINA